MTSHGEPQGKAIDQQNPPRRKAPEHGVLIVPGVTTVVFVTACTKDREPWLASPRVHETLRYVWFSAQSWFVGRYVVMPDHIHLFATPGEPELDIEAWMKYWKRQVTTALGQSRGKWQRDQWHMRMRTVEHYNEKLEYVLENPVRAGLAVTRDTWPYRGEIFPLEWHG